MGSRNEVKIIYYGPGVSGCTTNIQYLASQTVPPSKVISYSCDEYFRLTGVSFPRLKNRGMPEIVVSKLQCLHDQIFHSEKEFLEAIRAILGNEQTQQYHDMILWQAHIAGRMIRLNLNLHDVRHITVQLHTHTLTELCFSTPPSSIYLDPLRREILEGLDGVIFVADSQEACIHRDISKLEELEENLRSYGHSLASLPWIMQYNKRDLPNILSIEELEEHLNTYHVPYIGAIASQGIGVIETVEKLLHIIEKKNKEPCSGTL